MDVSVFSIVLLSASILTAAKASPQAEDSSERFDGRRRDLQRKDFPFDTQNRLPNDNSEKENRALDILGLGALGRYPGNHLGGLLGPLGGFPVSQSTSGITGHNVNQNLDQGLFRGHPGHLNGLLAHQGLIGTVPGLVGSNPNLIGGTPGLIGTLSGLVAGTNGLGNAPPLGISTGRSPFGDIMAMASFLTKDELHDMFSTDRNFNFIPVALQNRNKQQEEQEVQQFIRFLNSRSEKENESFVSGNAGFDKRDQRSLTANPILAQQIRGNGLQILALQNLLQSGVNPLLLSQNLRPSGGPNSILPQHNLLQGQGINPLLALRSTQNSLQSQLQSSSNNIFTEPLHSQGQSNQVNNSFGLNPLMHQALLREARFQQSLPTQQPQLQALQQLLLRSARDSDHRHEQEVSARLPVEHKQAPFRFPFE